MIVSWVIYSTDAIVKLCLEDPNAAIMGLSKWIELWDKEIQGALKSAELSWAFAYPRRMKMAMFGMCYFEQ